MRRTQFWIYIDYEPKTRCWLWTRSVDGAGYGQATVPGLKGGRAHRISWQLVNGPIRDGMMVCHKCDVPSCINPAHLYLGNALTNYQDSIRGARVRPFDAEQLTEGLGFCDLLLDTDLRDPLEDYADTTVKPLSRKRLAGKYVDRLR